MNIIVTIPKSERNNMVIEEEFATSNRGNITQFWNMKRPPKNINVGDRVYFVEGGYIAYYQEVIAFGNDLYCEATKRSWPGFALILKYPPVKLNNRIKMKGFQGFRYADKKLTISG